ncbi:MAG: glucosaminidase domain-containing protein [Bacteroidales bacterium]|nr:glucosaminidase domain-containing protein [Bacteroidales bacterium]
MFLKFKIFTNFEVVKRIAIILAAFVAAQVAFAQDGGSPYERYIAQYSGIAVEEMIRSGVPASITMAQALLESGAGQSRLAVEGNNHFGIKCGSAWQGKSMKADDDKPDECFRVYDSVEESYRDHSDFLHQNSRYDFLFDLYITDYKGWAIGLKKAGYATSPEYASHLITLIENYKLYDLDFVESGEPEQPGVETPAVTETPEQPEKPGKEDPTKPIYSAPVEQNQFSLQRELYNEDGVPFIVSYQGETYKSIAKNYHLFLGELLRYNGLKANQELKPGIRVYLQPHKNK